MDNERFQIIPRKKGQLLYPILTGIIYITAFGILFFDFQYNLIYYIIGFLLLYLGLTFFEYTIWRLNWHKLGELTGLNKEEINLSTFFKAPDLSGNYRGYPFLLSTFSVGFGRSKKYFTKILVELPFSLEGDLFLKKKSFLQQNLETTGIEEFDKTFYLKTDLDWVKNRLFQNRDIKDGLLDILKQSKSMQLNAVGNQLSHQEKLRIKDTEYLIALMDFLIKMAGVFRQNYQGSMFSTD